MYALCKLSYLHKPWSLSDFSILLHSVFKSDTASMSIIIHLVYSNVVSVGVMFRGESIYLDICCFFMFESVFVGCKLMILGNWKSVVLSFMGLSATVFALILYTFGVFTVLVLPALGVISELVTSMSDVRSVWFNLCVTYFIVSSIMSLWSVSNSELNWAEIELIAYRVLWWMGGGRLSFVGLGL